MLPILLNTPKSVDEWDRFSFHHRTSHDLIRQAIQTQFNVALPDYVLDPIPLNQPLFFLENNQQAHTDFDGILGVQSSDLEDVNLSDERQLQAWIYLHYLEHQTAENTLGIAS